MAKSNNKSYEISSDMLAQIQVLFASGSTLESVVQILDAGKATEDSRGQKPKAASSADFTDLAAEVSTLMATTQALMEMDEVRAVPAITGSVDLIFHSSQSVLKEIAKSALSIEGVASKPEKIAQTAPKKTPAKQKQPASAKAKTPPSKRPKPKPEQKKVAAAQKIAPNKTAAKVPAKAKAASVLPKKKTSASTAATPPKGKKAQPIPTGILPVNDVQKPAPKAKPAKPSVKSKKAPKPKKQEAMHDRLSGAIQEISVLAEEADTDHGPAK